jgi:chromosome partitioning protein
LSEILLDISDDILLVVGLDTLGLQGYTNTIQYFVDCDIDLAKIRYVIPIGYHPIKLTPNKCLKQLQEMAKTYTPNAKISVPIKDKSVIKNLQFEGVSVFDEHEMKDKFHEKNRDEVKKDLTEVFESINL